MALFKLQFELKDIARYLTRQSGADQNLTGIILDNSLYCFFTDTIKRQAETRQLRKQRARHKTMAEEEEEEEWQSPHLQSLSSPPSSSSSHTLSPIRSATPRQCHRLHRNDLSIFPPFNHEGLLIPPPPRTSLSLSSSDSDCNSRPPSPSPKPPPSHFAKWVDFALHLCNSKLQSFLTHVRSLGLVSSIRLVGSIAPFLVVLCFWVLWRRRRRCGGGGQESESVEQFQLLLKEKDEKIIQLLEQIAQMNKLLLARYRIPVLKSS